jgi:Flp pilus assembly protein TadB
VNLAALLGAAIGIGCIGVVHGWRAHTPTLASIAGSMNGTGRPRFVGREPIGLLRKVGRSLVERAEDAGIERHQRWIAMQPSLAITGQSAEELATKMLVSGGAGLIGPPLLWVVAQAAGVQLGLEAPILLAVVAVPAGICLPVASLLSRAQDRRRHFRAVIGSFVDLVVLSLAGGVGIEGALFAAAQVSRDWAAQRLARTLLRARDSGQSPWAALGQLGEEIGLPELVELSTALELAGTEGARIRQSLSARAISLRRHEQADAESAANSTTERLFLPGALLVVGFLLFIGYPALSRILGGF